MSIKRMMYVLLVSLFVLNGLCMLYFGKETFQIKAKPIAAKKYDYHFVLISEERDNEYWRLIEKGARNAANENNVYLEYLGPKQANNAEQLEYMDKSISGNVDGMIVQGMTSQPFEQLVNKSFEKGIPVVTVDTDAPESERKVYVGSDNYLAGFLAGNAFIHDTVGKQFVGIVTGRLDSSSQQLRIKGFKDAIQPHGRAELVAIKESNITKSGAVQATYDLLREHPNLTAFYGTSALDGTGISQVVNQLHMDPYIIAFDLLPQTMQYMRQGSIDATIAQYPYEMGFQAIEKLLQLEQDKSPEELNYTETKIVRLSQLPARSAPLKGELE